MKGTFFYISEMNRTFGLVENNYIVLIALR
jgi:hypothetical protein